MKKYLRDYLYLFLLAGVIVALDQWSKSYITTHLAVGEVWSPWDWLMPYARFVHWTNTGVAFGMFQGKGDIFKILSLLVALAIVYYYPRIPYHDWILRTALGLQLGGAVGNLVDRFTQGHVVDFISVGNFPVFNVADSCITIGVGILILDVIIQDRREKAEALAAARAAASGLNADSEAPSGEESQP